MMQYHRVPTSYAVYRTILDEHSSNSKLNNTVCVFESYTNIVEHGPCTIYTLWGFKGSDCALVGAKTTYDMEWGEEVKGTTLYEYWLCAPICECED